MSYGLEVARDNKLSLRLDERWVPASYIGTIISRPVPWNGSGSTSKTFTVPDGMILIAVPARNTSIYRVDTWTQNGNRYTEQTFIIWNVTVINRTVTIKEVLSYFGIIKNPNIGKLTTEYNVFGYYPDDFIVNTGDYGLVTKSLGIMSFINQSTLIHTLKFKLTKSIGRSSSVEYSLGISGDEPPLCFVSDSGKNAIATYVHKKNNIWHIVIKRGHFKCVPLSGATVHAREYAIPNAGTVRIAAFSKFSGNEEGYGLSIYGNDGNCIYSSSELPLLLQRSLTAPTPNNEESNGSTRMQIPQRGGDVFTSLEMQQQPMFTAIPQGIYRSRWLNWQVGVGIDESNRFRCGCSLFIDHLRMGAFYGAWGEFNGENYFINGTDYFDDY